MRRVLGDTLRGIGVNEESVDDILLAATEACTNVVLHAGESAPAYSVAATVDRAGCRVEVTDVGRGYAPEVAGQRWPMRLARTRRATADRATADRGTGDVAGLAESGRGLAIMRACVDDVKLRTAPGRGTRVVLDKRLEWAGPLRRSA
jgi:serine/threonine-protein kinase RsbW